MDPGHPGRTSPRSRIPEGLAPHFRDLEPLGPRSWRGRDRDGRAVVLKPGPYSGEDAGVPPWVVREFVPGTAPRGPLPLPEAMAHLRDLLAALAPLHDKGTFHGRVKPANLVAGVLLDAGPAVELTEPSSAAPEQTGALPGPPGPPSDLYAAGAFLYELITGRPPTWGETMGEFLRGQALAPVPALDLGLPGLDAYLARLMAKEPGDRYQHAGGALADLGRMQANPSGFVPCEARDTLAAAALVDRQSELDRLLARLGGGGAVALVGPAGVGKTRLVDETLRRAVARGHRVLRCRARDVQLSVHPLEEVAQDLLSDGDASLAERLGPWAPLAVAALPLLEPLLGPPGDPGPETHAGVRTRRALAHLLQALGTPERPALVVFEDLHLGPPDLLEILQQATEAPHTLLLLTSREPLPVESLSLGPLSRNDLDHLARSMAGPLPEAALDTLADLSEGNPFLAVETLAAMAAGGVLEPGARGWAFHPERLSGSDAPGRAGQLLGERFERLAPTCAEVMATAAVLGREFETRLLAALAPEAERHLEEARQAHLVLRAGPGRWVFAHDRLREVALSRLDPETRRERHRAAARHLDPQRVADRAFHLHQSGDLAAARPLAEEAARRAPSPDAAEFYYGLALEADPGDPVLLEALGDVRRRAGRFAAAEEAYLRVRPASRDDEARILGHRGLMAFQVGDLPKAADLLLRALELLGHPLPRGRAARAGALAREVASLAAPPPARPAPLAPRDRLAADLLDHLAYVLAYRDGYGLIWANLRGLNLTRRGRPGREFGTALASHAIAVLYVPGLVGRARACARRAVEVQAAHGTPFELAAARAREAAIRLFTDDPREALRQTAEAMAVLARSGVPYEAHMVAYNHALALYRLGRLAEARRLALANHRDAVQAGNGLGAAYSLRVLGLTGPLEREWVEVVEALGDHRHVALLVEEARAVRHLQEDRPGEAIPHLESARRQALALNDVLEEHQAEVWLARARRLEADRLDAAEGGRRRSLYGAARRSARRAEALARAAYRVHLPRALREKAWLAAERGHDGRALEALRESVRVARELGMDWDEALGLLDLASFGRARGVPDAPAWQAEARDLLDRTGTTWEVSRPHAAAPPALADRFDQVLAWGRTLATSLSEDRVLENARRAAEALLRTECRRRPPLPAEESVPRLVETDDRSALVIPLRSRERAVAHLYCFHREVRGYFGPDELRLASFVGTLAGAALENAHLIRQGRHRQARLEALFSGFGAGLAVVGADGRVVEANRTLREMVGATVGTRFSDIVDPTDRPTVERAVQDLLAGRRDSCLEEIRLGGHAWAQVSGRAVTARDGRTRQAIMAVSDVSHRRLVQIARFQETERRLLAAEVHDVISQPLVGLHYRLDTLALEERPVAPIEMALAADLARGVLQEVRSMIYQLRTPALEEMRLGAALREGLREMTSDEGPELDCRIDDGVDEARGLPALFAHRILVEALANVRRHAGARRVRVRLRVCAGRLAGQVADDGRGFDPNGVTSRSFGLRVMRERAELLGGTVRLRSRAGRGTVVCFRLPLEEGE